MAIKYSIMREILREKIESLLPPGALNVTRTAEESERDFLLTIAKTMDGEAS